MAIKSDLNAKVFRFISFFVIFWSTAAIAEDQDRSSWIYNDKPKQDSQAITKWCSKDGERIAYSLSQPKDFEQCGKLETAVYCDPAGNKYIGPGKPPYAYQDCSVGPRIQVVRTIPAGEYRAPKNDSSDFNWKVSDHAAKPSEDNSYFQMLDGLLGGIGGGVVRSKFSNEPSAQHKDQRPTKGPFAPSYLVQKAPNQESQSGNPLEHILDQLADDN